MRFKYIPGLRPTPMLMYYVDHNENVFNEMLNEDNKLINFGTYINNLNHIWNIGSYIIYDEQSLVIKSVVINDFSNFIFLLRNMNKPLIFEISDEIYNVIKTEIEGDFKDEFELI